MGDKITEMMNKLNNLKVSNLKNLIKELEMDSKNTSKLRKQELINYIINNTDFNPLKDDDQKLSIKETNDFNLRKIENKKKVKHVYKMVHSEEKNYPELDRYIDIINKNKNYQYIVLYENKLLMFKNDKDLLHYKNINNLNTENYKLYETVRVLGNKVPTVKVLSRLAKVVCEYDDDYDELNKKSTPINRIPVETIKYFVPFSLFINGSKEEAQTIFFLIDTGATISCIPMSILEKFGGKKLILGKTPIIGHDYNSIKDTVSLMISDEPVDETIQEKLNYFNIRAVILDKDDTPILGMDVINYYNITMANTDLYIEVYKNTREERNLQVIEFNEAIKMYESLSISEPLIF